MDRAHFERAHENHVKWGVKCNCDFLLNNSLTHVGWDSEGNSVPLVVPIDEVYSRGVEWLNEG